MGNTSHDISSSAQDTIAATTSSLSTTTASRPVKDSYYFGYGSNLWLDQMRRRCPSSKYIGTAILHDWKWIISDRGYANVIPSPGDIVWGMVYILSAIDEAYLDRNEGAPTIYEKKVMNVDFMPAKGLAVEGGLIQGLVYVDVKRTHVGDIAEEYIYRMNQAIKDAVQMGVPEEYIERCLRPFIPAEDPPGAGEVKDPFAVR